MIVADASVLAVALADDGPDGDQARARLHGEHVALPELTDLEVASALRRQLTGCIRWSCAYRLAQSLRREAHHPATALDCGELLMVASEQHPAAATSRSNPGRRAAGRARPATA